MSQIGLIKSYRWRRIMKLLKKCPRGLTWFVPLIFLCSAPLMAQSIWLTSDQKSSVSLEIIKPSFENYSGEIDTKLLNMVTFLSIKNHFQKDIAFVAEIPFAKPTSKRLIFIMPAALLGKQNQPLSAIRTWAWKLETGIIILPETSVFVCHLLR